MVDRIVYLGRDMEDAIKAGLIRKTDISFRHSQNLGTENGKIIGIFVNDTIANSYNRDSIEMSEEVFHYMYQLKLFNYQHIYQHPEVERKSHKAAHMIELLFSELEYILKNGAGKNSPTLRLWQKRLH